MKEDARDRTRVSRVDQDQDTASGGVGDEGVRESVVGEDGGQEHQARSVTVGLLKHDDVILCGDRVEVTEFVMRRAGCSQQALNVPGNTSQRGESAKGRVRRVDRGG